jgi:hypothetical protein
LSVWAKVKAVMSSKLANLTCVQKRKNWWRYRVIDLKTKEAHTEKKVLPRRITNVKTLEMEVRQLGCDQHWDIQTRKQEHNTRTIKNIASVT